MIARIGSAIVLLVGLLASSVLAEEPDSRQVQGVVVDAQQQPVAEASLVLVLRHGRGDDLWQVEGTTDAQGEFTLQVPARWLEPGPFYSDRTLWVHAPGHAVATTSAAKQLGKDNDDPLRVELTAETPLKVTVFEPSGAPHPGANVQPYHWHTGHIPPKTILDKVAAETDAHGVATLTGVAPKLLTALEIVSDQYGKQHLRVGRNAGFKQDGAITIQLIDTGALQGQLVCDDKSIVAYRRISAGTWGNAYGDIDGAGETVTDEAGHFRMEHLPEGRYTLLIAPDETATLLPQVPAEIPVEAGGTATIDIPYVESVEVRGKVVARGSDRPVAKAFVSVSHGERFQHQSVLTEGDGNFTARVLPGSVRRQLIAIPEPFSDWIRVPDSRSPIDVAATDGPVDLPPLEIVESKKVAGRVIDEQGKGVADVTIALVKDNRSIGSGRSDAKGNFTMSLPPDATGGHYSLYATDGQRPGVKVESESPLVLRMVDPNSLANVKATARPTPADKLKPPAPHREVGRATLVVARPTLIFENRAILWDDLAAELEKRAGVRGGDLETVELYRTHGAYDDETRTEEARNWAGMLSETTGVKVQEHGLIFNQAADRYDVLEITDSWPPPFEQPVAGRVVDGEGNPVANAQVVLLAPSPATSRYHGTQTVYLANGHVRSPSDHIVEYTNPDGYFSFDFPTSRTSLMILAPEGFALVTAKSELEDIALAPWARVTAKVPQSPALGLRTLSLSIYATPEAGGQITIHMSDGSPLGKPQTSFELAAVPPGQSVSVSRTLWTGEENNRQGNTEGEPYRFETGPGMTHHLEFGEPSGSVAK